MSDSSSSESTRPCPKCGEPIVAGDANGLCAACLMAEVAHSTVPASAPKKAWVPPDAEEMGRLLPQYRIERMLGRGGMGAVYQGRQVALDRGVAIKILSNDLDEADSSFAERFKNEARAMAKLSHPSIVTVHDFGETENGLLYIVMEFVEGTDVAKMIAGQGRLHSEHAMAITAHVCDALAYAHERGIIHRDIKPANIMVSYEGVVKVADFGLAKFSTTAGETLGLTQSGMAMGTLHFMAPEALTLGTAVDHRADIYAVGVMLYQMLTGKLPHGMFELPSIQVNGLDPRYDGIIAKAMREDRALRYQSAREMRQDLDGILTQPVQQVEPEPTRPVATLPEEARPRRSPAGKARPHRPPPMSTPAPVKKKSSAGIVLLTLGLLGAIGAALFYLGQDRKVPAGVKASATVGQPAATSATTTDLAAATKDAPFVNTLGMKFVPVPGTKVLFCIHEVRYRDYAAYAAETSGIDKSWEGQTCDGYDLTQNKENHPVIKVNWKEAQKFCEWLSDKEGKTFRLPTDQEWSVAVGIGQDETWKKDTTPATVFKSQKQYPWGDKWPPPNGSGNYSDESRKAKAPHPSAQYLENFDDGYPTTAPVMSFKPNTFGLYDMGGNVWEWCEDWYDNAENDRVLRGCSWGNRELSHLLSSNRNHYTPTVRSSMYGFRVVVELPEAAPPGPSASKKPVSPSPSLPVSFSPSSATKDAPFVNTLGMKFVPVPGTKVLFCIHETRRQDYAAYAKEVPALDQSWNSRTWYDVLAANRDDQPVSAVCWLEAEAFCAWLSKRENITYRLPTDREWSQAVGIGHLEVWSEGTTPQTLRNKIRGVYPWGNQLPPPGPAGNYADTAYHEQFPTKKFMAGYSDGFAMLAPVMSFEPNQYGIYDLSGNVAELVLDWFDTSQKEKVLRGGSFTAENELYLLSSWRGTAKTTDRSRAETAHLGFRIVVELPESAPASPAASKTTASPSPSLPVSSSSATATKDAPFVNTLGMKFVPVPITGGPTDKQRVLFSIWETRVQDYEVFVKELGRKRAAPPFNQGLTHPAVGMNWSEAKEFCAWLTERERKSGNLSANEVYRLPSDHEWSCAVGIGDREDPALRPIKKGSRIAGIYPWGTTWPPPARTGNFAGEELTNVLANGTAKVMSTRAQLPIPNYRDEFEATAPVGSFPANPLGLFDLEGNVLEWCEDKFEASPKDDGVMRGGCWGSGAEDGLYLSSYRQIYPRKSGFHFYNGFRCVLAPAASESPPASTAVSPSPSLPVSSSPSTSTKDAPFTNTLGMKFVPVPGTKVLFSVWMARVRDYRTFAIESNRDWSPATIGQQEDHPAVKVSWEDASAFCAWLTTFESRTGQLPRTARYRLPTDAEWSVAVGLPAEAGATPAEKAGKNKDHFPWGGDFPPTAKVGNYADALWHAQYPDKPWIEGYDDGHAALSPVGSFPANAHGLHDMGGNVWQWCEDWLDARQQDRVARGGSWSTGERSRLLSSFRSIARPDESFENYGFRVVLETGAP